MTLPDGVVGCVYDILCGERIFEYDAQDFGRQDTQSCSTAIELCPSEDLDIPHVAIELVDLSELILVVNKKQKYVILTASVLENHSVISGPGCDEMERNVVLSKLQGFSKFRPVGPERSNEHRGLIAKCVLSLHSFVRGCLRAMISGKDSNEIDASDRRTSE